MVLEALFRKIRSGCSKELLYGNHVVLGSKTLKSLKGKLKTWKGLSQSKGSIVTVRKDDNDDN